MNATEDRLRVWRASNPLHRYRKSTNRTRLSVACALAVSEQTVRNWEVGAANPAEGTLTHMVRLGWFGSNAWENWKAERPNE